jgi:hypothetical protein
MSLLLIQACSGQDAPTLPAEMPENITIDLYQGGGKTRAFKKITIDENVLAFEELSGNTATPRKWSARVAREDLAKLYKVFVDNRFDSIKNDEPKGRAYDAGSESIAISIDQQKTFRATYGKNSPLSGVNLERYEKVRTALDDLTKRLAPGEKTVGENEKFIQGTWRAGGENGGHAWYLEWTFDGENFKQIGYPPIVQEGKYRVVSNDGDKLTIELYEQKGTFGEDRRQIEILVDKQANQLTISNMKEFRRTVDKKND